MNARDSYGERGGPAPSWHQESWAQDIGKPAFAGLGDDTTVTRDQPAQHLVGVPGPVDKVLTTPLTEEADHDDGQASPFDAHLDAGDTRCGPGLRAPSQGT